MLALCVCACIDLCINIFCPAVIFMSHLPILQFSPCCCHQHFVFSAWLLPASDSRDSKEDPALSTQQQNRSVWAALWQILQHKTQTCYFSFIWAIPRSQTEITPAGCQLPPFPPLWFLIPALHPRCLFSPRPGHHLARLLQCSPLCFGASSSSRAQTQPAITQIFSALPDRRRIPCPSSRSCWHPWLGAWGAPALETPPQPLVPGHLCHLQDKPHLVVPTKWESPSFPAWELMLCVLLGLTFAKPWEVLPDLQKWVLFISF